MALTWLAPYKDHILERLGAAPDPMSDVALELAEEKIDKVTGLIWGQVVQGVELKRHLTGRSYTLQVPKDVVAVHSIEPEVDGTLFLDDARVYVLDSNSVPVAFGGGIWTLTVDRGITPVPRVVIEAAGILAAGYLQPPDPDRSRFSGFRLGDFSGSWNGLSVTGVPEADNLLGPYMQRVKGGLL